MEETRDNGFDENEYLPASDCEMAIDVAMGTAVEVAEYLEERISKDDMDPLMQETLIKGVNIGLCCFIDIFQDSMKYMYGELDIYQDTPGLN